MRYQFDTEFLEDGKTIDFISIGMVAEDGRELYRVSAEFNTRKVAANDWLMENVMTSIDHETFVVSEGWGMPIIRDLIVTDPAKRPVPMIAADIVEFIGDDPDPELWAWYSAYDHVCLAQIFGRMIDLPENIPMFTNDIKTLSRRIKKLTGKEPFFPKQPAGKHNALDDARWNVVRYDYAQGILDELNA